MALMLACFSATSSFAGTAGKFEGWEIEQGVDLPSYAVIDPQSTDLNLDSVVLACEQAVDRRVLEFQIYLSTEGPLLPNGVQPQQLKDNPHAEIVIDDGIFPVSISFADDYAVLADGTEQMFPSLSERLVDATEKGRSMTLRPDLVDELVGQPAAFDGEALIALQAGGGGMALSAVRRCATTAGVVSARHDRH